jgi:hypothetical protein
MTALAKISKAEAATDRVLSLVCTALEQLHRFEGRIVNGHGVFSDPSQKRQSLRAASRAIEEALAEMDKAQWPTPTDYSDAEERG